VSPCPGMLTVGQLASPDNLPFLPGRQKALAKRPPVIYGDFAGGHSMAIWPAQQQFPRYQIRLPILHTLLSPPAGRAGMGWTRDLSEGGACVELAEAVPVDARVRLRFQTEHETIEADAEVVWAAAPDGVRGVVPHGVAFTRIAPEQHQILRELFLTKAKARHTGVRIGCDLVVAYQAKDHAEPPQWGWMENVSRGGLLLSLPQPLPPGTRLTLTWQIASERLTAEGMIVWVEPTERPTEMESVRHGFRFTTLNCSPSTLRPAVTKTMA
jgi:hypothetical protein